MNRSHIFVITLVLTLAFVDMLVGIPTASAKSEKRSRVEELFEWMVTDRLELPLKTETLFTEEFRRLSKEKTAVNAEIESTIAKVELEKDISTQTTLLNQYSKLLEKLNRVQADEVGNLRKILGDQKFAQYLGLKRQLAERLKTLISQNASAGGKLPAQETKPVEKQ